MFIGTSYSISVLNKKTKHITNRSTRTAFSVRQLCKNRVAFTKPSSFLR